MSSRTRTLGVVAGLVAATLLLAQAARAQEILSKSAPAASAAVQLESRALAMLDAPDRWSDVATSLEKAAALRSADDRRGVSDLVMAAGAHWSAGKVDAAYRTFVAAGERALAVGSVYTAAYAFLMGAVAANEVRGGAAALELKTRAELLASSPHMTPPQRDRIFAQFKQAGAAADR